jgi:hypothetical protein
MLSDTPMVPIQNGNLEIYYYIDKICQANNRLASYIYQNNKWNTFTKPWVILLENTAYQNQSYHGGIVYNSSYHKYIEGTGIVVYGNTSLNSLFTFANKIDLSLYSKVEVTFYTGVNTVHTLAVIQSTEAHNGNPSNFPSTASVITSQSFNSSPTPQTVTFDITNANETVYFGLYTIIGTHMVITDIKLS